MCKAQHLNPVKFFICITGIIHPIPKALGTHHGKNNSIYRPCFPFCFPKWWKGVHPTQQICSRNRCGYHTWSRDPPVQRCFIIAMCLMQVWSTFPGTKPSSVCKSRVPTSLGSCHCHILGSPRCNSALPAGMRPLPITRQAAAAPQVLIRSHKWPMKSSISLDYGSQHAGGLWELYLPPCLRRCWCGVPCCRGWQHSSGWMGAAVGCACDGWGICALLGHKFLSRSCWSMYVGEIFPNTFWAPREHLKFTFLHFPFISNNLLIYLTDLSLGPSVTLSFVFTLLRCFSFVPFCADTTSAVSQPHPI